MEIAKYKCFGSNQQTGNVAYVIINDEMSDNERQNFAAQANVPVCVYIDKIVNDFVNVSFYYPHKISPLCLHGSLATAKFIFSKYPQLQQFTIESSLAKKLVVIKNDDNASLLLNFEFSQDAKQYREQVCTFLGLSNEQLDADIVVASVGSYKLLVEVVSKNVLFNLAPDLLAIDSWNKQANINGIYAYCQHDGKIYARNFNHLVAKLEDAATGVGAAALCGYLKRDIIVHQGYNLSNPCHINLVYAQNEIELSGIVVNLE